MAYRKGNGSENIQCNFIARWGAIQSFDGYYQGTVHHSEKLGLQADISGNRFHSHPDRFFAVGDVVRKVFWVR